MTTITAPQVRPVIHDDPVTDEGHFALLVGTLAYFDTVTPQVMLVPCQVLEVSGPGELVVGVTVARPGYERGQRITVVGNNTVRRVVPRTQVWKQGPYLRVAGHPVIAYRR